MNEFAHNLNDGHMATEEGQNNNVTIKALLKATKEYDYRLATYFGLLKNRYDQIIKTHNLDEIRECMIRLIDTQFMITNNLKELLRSEESLLSRSANNTILNPHYQQPVTELTKHAQQVTEIGKRIKSLQKELNVFCPE